MPDTARTDAARTDANPPGPNPTGTARIERARIEGARAGSRLSSPSDAAAADLARVERVASLLDTRFAIPGTGLRFGLDSLVGLVPGLGDTAMLLPSLWIIAVARRHGVPRRTLARMGLNAGLDFVVGSVPVAGDIFDLFYKSHRKNAVLLRRALAREGTAAPRGALSTKGERQ